MVCTYVSKEPWEETAFEIVGPGSKGALPLLFLFLKDLHFRGSEIAVVRGDSVCGD